MSATAILSGMAGIATDMYGINEAKRQNKAALHFQKNRFQFAARDAQKAGLHPLWALGAGGAPNMPAQTMADLSGTREAARTIGRAIDGKALEKAQLNSVEAQTLKSIAEADYANKQADFIEFQMAESLLNRADQTANGQQDVNKVLKIDAGTNLHLEDTVPQQDIENEFGGIVGELYGLSRAISHLNNIRVDKPKKPKNKVWRNKDGSIVTDPELLKFLNKRN